MRQFIKYLIISHAVLYLPIYAFGKEILLQSTTSTNNSGFYKYLLPKFKEFSGISVQVVAVGTGQALKNAQNCDADMVIVHSKKAEEKFVASGFGLKRYNLMYNDFVIIGPESDPAMISTEQSIHHVLEAIFKVKASFISRGDNSGTHKKEVDLWKITQIHPQKYSGTWYKEVGAGMGATLNISAELNAYTLSDRATWLTFKNKKNLKILFEGDPSLFNQYGAILVNPQKCPNAKYDLAEIFLDWVLSDVGQTAIENYKINKFQLFYPNSNR